MNNKKKMRNTQKVAQEKKKIRIFVQQSYFWQTQVLDISRKGKKRYRNSKATLEFRPLAQDWPPQKNPSVPRLSGSSSTNASNKGVKELSGLLGSFYFSLI
jgi:hypothetical protein